MRRNLVWGMIVLGAALAATAPHSEACSRVFWNANKQAMVVARTLDLYMPDQALIMFYPRGLERDGNAGSNSARWRAKYATLAVTAFGSATSDLVNEHGLAGHLLYLEGTKYETRDDRAGVANLLLAQYLLDNCKTVNEALAEFTKIQVVSAKASGREWPVHLAIEDPTGDSAIIEFIAGKAAVHHGRQYTVMTNEPPLAEQIANAKLYRPFGGKLPLPGDIDPASRYVRAATFLRTLPEPQNYTEALAGVLSVIRTVMVPFGAQDSSETVAQDTWPTLWANAIDLNNRVLYFHSTRSPNLFWVDMKAFDPNGPVLMLDPYNPRLGGEVSKMFQRQ